MWIRGGCIPGHLGGSKGAGLGWRVLLCCVMRLWHRHMDAGLPPGFAGLWRLLKLHAGHAHSLLQAHSPVLILGQVVAAARIDLQPI